MENAPKLNPEVDAPKETVEVPRAEIERMKEMLEKFLNGDINEFNPNKEVKEMSAESLHDRTADQTRGSKAEGLYQHHADDQGFLHTDVEGGQSKVDTWTNPAA